MKDNIWTSFKRGRWGIGKTAALSTGICAAVMIASAYQLYHENETSFQITFWIGLALTAVSIFLIHLWSVKKSNVLSGIVDKHPCDYCGASSTAKIICSNCQSIQWKWIQTLLETDKPTSDNNGLRYPGTMSAVFFAYHRFKIIGACLSVIIIGGLSFQVKYHMDKSKRDSENQANLAKQTDIIVDALTAYRGALYDFNAFCKASAKTHGFTSFCEHQRETINRSFYKVSWYAPPLLLKLNKFHNCPSPKNDYLKSACTVSEYKYVNLMTDQLDAMYRAFSEQFHHGITDDTLVSETAKRFYSSGKRIQCALILFNADNDDYKQNKKEYFGCKYYTDEFIDSYSDTEDWYCHAVKSTWEENHTKQQKPSPITMDTIDRCAPDSKKDWNFIQSTGGVSIEKPILRKGKWILSIKSNTNSLVSDKTSDTWTIANAAINPNERNIYITIDAGQYNPPTSFPVIDTTADLGKIQPGKYHVFYRNPITSAEDKTAKNPPIGEIEITKSTDTPPRPLQQL